MKRGRRAWLYLTIFGAVAVAGLGGVVLWRVVPRMSLGRGLPWVSRQSERNLEAILQSADEALSRGYPSRAEAALEEGYDEARGEGEVLRVLRRELRLAELTGSYRRLTRSARRAWEELPGSRRLAELAVYATLRGERPEEAAALLSRARRLPELDGLRAEAFLAGQLPDPGLSRSAPQRLRTLTELARVRDAAGLHTLADLLEEPRLDVDAALLWMQQGRAEEAFAALWPQRQEAEAMEPLALMAIDAGRYAEAGELLGSDPGAAGLPDRAAVRGDLAWLLGRPDRAAELYQQAIQLGPGYSWIPYLNLAALLEAAGDREGAMDFRRRAHALFPGQAEVVLAHARDLAATGARERALELVESLLDRDPAQVSAQLLSLELAGARGSPALFRGRMWELVNRHPENSEVAQSFALYLVSMRDLSGAEAVLSQYERANAGTAAPWLREMRGVLAFARGNAAEAVTNLRACTEAGADWRRCYNLAVALMAVKRDGEAIDELMRSESALSAAGATMGSREAPRYRSLMRSRIAEAQLHLGDPDSARREALYALDIDSGNQHARRVLRILDGPR